MPSVVRHPVRVMALVKEVSAGVTACTVDGTASFRVSEIICLLQSEFIALFGNMATDGASTHQIRREAKAITVVYSTALSSCIQCGTCVHTYVCTHVYLYICVYMYTLHGVLQVTIFLCTKVLYYWTTTCKVYPIPYSIRVYYSNTNVQYPF